MSARRRVFHSHWKTLGWHNRFDPGRSHVTWSFMPSQFNRPIIRWSWHLNERWFCIEWGNGNSDPAWSIGYQWADREPLPSLTDEEWDAFVEAAS